MIADSTISAGQVTESDSEGTYDVAISIHVSSPAGRPAYEICGHVTMQSCVDGRPGYEACGHHPDQWVSPRLLRLIEREGLDLVVTLREIESIASGAIGLVAA